MCAVGGKRFCNFAFVNLYSVNVRYHGTDLLESMQVLLFWLLSTI